MSEDGAQPLSGACWIGTIESESDSRSGEIGSTGEVVVDLYEKMRPALVGYAFQITNSVDDAEDIVQVSFLRVFDQLNRKAKILHLRSWIYRVIHNLAIDLVRKSAFRARATQDLSAEYAGTASSAEQGLIRRQQVRKILDILNERERHCLMLRAEGLSYQEIAQVMDISAKSVSVYLARGLKKLRELDPRGQL